MITENAHDPGESGGHHDRCARRTDARSASAAARLATLVGSSLLLVFMVQNTDRITLQFLFWSFTWPLWLFTLASALVGALVWFGLGVMRRHRRRKARREDRRD